MDCPIACGGSANQTMAVGVHAFRPALDPLIAYPGWISSDDVESASGHHVREVNVVGKEVELTIVDGAQPLSRFGDARVQLAAAAEVHRAHAAEKILLRSGKLLQFALVAVDGFDEQLRPQTLIVVPDQTRQGRAFLLRSAAISRDHIRLRAKRRHPLAINIAAAIAEKVDRTEKRVALQD